MGRPLGGGLRRKLPYVYDQGEGTLEQLGPVLGEPGLGEEDFRRPQPHRQAERVPYKPGASHTPASRHNNRCGIGFFSSPILPRPKCR